MDNIPLDKFGKFLIEHVRDEAIDRWFSIIDGEMDGASTARIRAALASIGPEHQAAIKWLLPQIVDSCLHRLMCGLEDSSEIELRVKVQGHPSENLKMISDGLAGELYTDDGWIRRFSRHEHVSPG